MSLGWQVLLAFIFGVFVTVAIFLVALGVMKWVVIASNKELTSLTKRGMSNIKKEIKEHFGIKEQEE